MNKIIASSIAAVALTAVGFNLINNEAEAESQASIATTPNFKTLTVGTSAIGSAMVLGGGVLPVNSVNLSAQMPGDVEFIAGKEGDAFKKGDLLVSLDTAALYAKRKQAETQLSSAEAGYRNALVQYQREVRSPNSQANQMMGGAPSMFSFFSDPIRSFTGEGDPGYERHSNLYQYSVGIQTAANQVEQAQAAIRELDENIRNAHSYAPFDGVILKKMIQEGDIVQPGMPLVTFADISNLEIQVEVPNNLLSKLRVGQALKARLDGQEQLINVEVERIYPSADAVGRTTTVKFKFLDSSPARSGMYAEVLIPEQHNGAAAAAVIPQSAITWRGSLPAVYLQTEDGQIKLRLLRIGERTPSGDVIVISGIRVGDTILANPADASR